MINHTISQQNNLTEREKNILRSIVYSYILNASPIGSRFLSKSLSEELTLSPATIRNVMSDLQEKELIRHAHISSGRIPTDKGYRLYVDSLMKEETLTSLEIDKITQSIVTDKSDFLKDVSSILSTLSNCLSVVKFPYLIDIVVQKVEVFQLSSTRIIVVLALESPYVRTLTLETDTEINFENIHYLTSIINEKISGKTLNFLRNNFTSIITETSINHHPLVRLFVNSMDSLFEVYHTNENKVIISGANKLVDLPEYENVSSVKGVIELIENEDIIVHLVDSIEESESDSTVLIGSEIGNERMEDYSMLVSSYSVGKAQGSIGLIGPKRMNYAKLLSILKLVSQTISK
jgi:heat-inducible transcriptional repressor